MSRYLASNPGLRDRPEDYTEECEHDYTHRMTPYGPHWFCADCGEDEPVDAPEIDY